MSVEGQRRVTRRDVDVEGGNPQRLLHQQLVDADREAARAGRVELNGQCRGPCLERGVAQEAARGVGIAGGDQIRPENVDVVGRAGSVERIVQRKLEAVDVALAGTRLRHPALDDVPRVELLRCEGPHVDTGAAADRHAIVGG